jgi:TPP-dependent pyruvate/acetoin dehydrogenase alpha subunit
MPSPTSPDLGRKLFRDMLRIRRVEDRIKAMYHLREMRSPPHLCMGHEGIAVGVCATLDHRDVIYPYYRSHGWYLAKGGDLNAMMAELFGRATGCSRGWGGSMHLIDLAAGVMGTSAIVGGTISHAAGAGLTFQMRGQSRVAVVAFGDGATEEGVFHETLNFAALRRLPVVFVCENNLYATNTHIRERQAQTEIYRHAERFGMPGVAADGNDVTEVHAQAARAVARARAGEGPTLIEAKTFRVRPHSASTPKDSRPEELIRHWEERDPIQSLAAILRGEHGVDAAHLAEIDAAAEAEIDEAVEFAKASPAPAAEQAVEDVYAPSAWQTAGRLS